MSSKDTVERERQSDVHAGSRSCFLFGVLVTRTLVESLQVLSHCVSSLHEIEMSLLGFHQQCLEISLCLSLHVLILNGFEREAGSGRHEEVKLGVFGEAALIAEVCVEIIVVDVPAESALHGVLPTQLADAVSLVNGHVASRTNDSVLLVNRDEAGGILRTNCEFKHEIGGIDGDGEGDETLTERRHHSNLRPSSSVLLNLSQVRLGIVDEYSDLLHFLGAFLLIDGQLDLFDFIRLLQFEIQC
jgi:hypothetical protein